MYGQRLSGQLFRFGFIGIVNTLIDFAVLNLLSLLFGRLAGAALVGCNTVAFVCANLNSYFANRRWTFGRRDPAAVREFSLFVTVSIVGLGINSAVLWLVTDGAPGSFVMMNLGKAAATLVSMGWNFFCYRLLLSGTLERKDSPG